MTEPYASYKVKGTASLYSQNRFFLNSHPPFDGALKVAEKLYLSAHKLVQSKLRTKATTGDWSFRLCREVVLFRSFFLFCF